MNNSSTLLKIKKQTICTFLFWGIWSLSFAQVFNGTTGAISDDSCPTPDVFTADVGTPNLMLDEITIDISHTFDSDLQIFLKSPDGKILELSTGNGGSGNNYSNTVFTDAAANFITSGSAPFTGSFKPEGRSETVQCNPAGTLGAFTIVSQFAASASDGIWELHVLDDNNVDVGALNSWSLTFVAPLSDDVAVVSVAHIIGNTACFGNTETVEVTIINNGLNDIAIGDAAVALTGSENSPLNLTNTTLLSMGVPEIITFNNVDLSIIDKLYTLTATALLAGDGNMGNNVVSTNTLNDCIVTVNGTAGALTNNSCPVADIFMANVVTLDIKLDKITLDISHNSDRELQLFLESPDGMILELSTDNGASGNDYINTVFTDDAPSFITTGSAPFTGVFKPEGRSEMVACSPNGILGIFTIDSQFGASNAVGTWQLHILDDSGGSVGVLNAWSLTFSAIPSDDVEVVSINHVIVGNPCFSNIETVEVTVLNRGLNNIAIGSLDLALTGSENSPLAMQNSTSIATNGIEIITFNGVDLSVIDNLYTLTAAATLAADMNHGNNEASTNVLNNCMPETTISGTIGGINDNNCPVGNTFTAIVVTPNLKLDKITLDITHNNAGDLLLFLESPDGMILEVSTRVGGSGDDYINTMFTDDAADFITTGIVPFTGMFKPEGRSEIVECNPGGTLGDFTIETQFGVSNSVGIWKLQISDDIGNGTTGFLNAWSLTFVDIPSEDVEVVSVTHIVNNSCFNNTETVEVIILNKGFNNIGIGDASIELAGAENSPLIMLNNTVIAFNAFDTITFANVDLSVIDKLYLLTATGTLVGDLNQANNAASVNTFNVCGPEFIVVNTKDGGQGSLREAIISANNIPGADVIEFQIDGAGPFIINLLTDLPVIVDTITIDGATLPAFAGIPLIEIQAVSEGLELNNADNSIIKSIALDGGTGDGIRIIDSDNFSILNCHVGMQADGSNGTGFGGDGIDIDDSINGLIQNCLVSNNQLDGIDAFTCDSLVIEGCIIGFDINGINDFGNGVDGMKVRDSPNCKVGGVLAAQRNIVGNNGDHGIAVFFNCTNAEIINNYAGIDINGTGTNNSGNQKSGISVSDAVLVKNNVCSGNKESGIRVFGDSARIEGNIVGFEADGLTPFGNDIGILIEGADNAIIGGPNLDQRNFIGNSQRAPAINEIGSGIFLTSSTNCTIENNFIGLNTTGTGALNDSGNEMSGIELENASNCTIKNNVITDNSRFGIKIRNFCTFIAIEGNIIGLEPDGITKRDINGLRGNNSGISISAIAGTEDITIGGPSITQRNIISGNAFRAITMTINSFVVNLEVVNNFVGTDITGTLDKGNGPSFNNNGSGLALRIFDNGLIKDNLISGNSGRGIDVFSSANVTIEGNKIGTDITGTTAIPNAVGIRVNLTPNNIASFIGGNIPANRNIVSGNTFGGIDMSTSDDVFIQGNFIGTDITGLLPMPNGEFGVKIDGSSTIKVGGTNPGEGNIIAHTTGPGVLIFPLDFFPSTQNEVSGNSIFNNTGLGIDLAPNFPGDGITPNDTLDADTGANELQNFPVISSATLAGGDVTITGTLSTTADTIPYRLDFYNNTGLNSSNNVEGEEYLGSLNVITNINGDTCFTVILPTAIAFADFVSATATDPDGNTSEFSVFINSGSDDDGDGFTVAQGDCNDNDNTIFPGAPELCDGIDNNCSGSPEAAINNWTGVGDGTMWDDPLNWSDGIVPLLCQDVIIPVGHDVTVPVGFDAKAKTLEVENGANLNVETGATMTIAN